MTDRIPHPGGRTISEVRNAYRGKTALVLGTGPSMESVAAKVQRDVTIGVNMASTMLPMDFLLCVDNPSRFDESRLGRMKLGLHREFVCGYHQCEPWRKVFPDAVVYFGRPQSPAEVPKPWASEPEFGWLPQYNGATYAATAFASYLGCSTIILGGADYTGVHSWSRDAKRVLVDQAMDTLHQRIQAEGGRVYNASTVSRLTMIPAWAG